MTNAADEPGKRLTRAIEAYRAGNLADAERICQQLIDQDVRQFDVLNLLAATQAAQGKSVLALSNYARAIAIAPRNVHALNNRGVLLRALGRTDEAVRDFDEALTISPTFSTALNNRAVALHELRHFEAAILAYDAALVVSPNDAEMHKGRSGALFEMRRYDEALVEIDRALAQRPQFVEALNDRAVILMVLRRDDEALIVLDRALALRSDYVAALDNRGLVLIRLRRHADALVSFEAALAIKSDDNVAYAGVAECSADLCDWERRTRIAHELPARIGKNAIAMSPFLLLHYVDDPILQLNCTRHYADRFASVPHVPISRTRHHSKLRIAYVSAEFRAHATAFLMAGLFEKHDRGAFDVVGISLGPDDGSAARRRVAAAFDTFHDVMGRSDHETATLIRDLEIDIAVDLHGYTANSRPGVFARRPAPIQVSYLGFPGTTGAPWLEYIIADRIVAPFADQPFFSERIVHLPDTYWVLDDSMPTSLAVPSRSEAGLPPSGFVFCCFNNVRKLTPEVFGIWMRLLNRVPGSVLWLLSRSAQAQANLRREAGSRGVEPARLIFAQPLPLKDHLARHALADLVLDTLPYNAHTTASDALWAGVPVVTAPGQTFASRVAASLVSAAEMPELAVPDLAAYEQLALRFAIDPAALREAKAKLGRHRSIAPLFDTARATRDIEAAYQEMYQTWQRGDPPHSFAV